LDVDELVKANMHYQGMSANTQLKGGTRLNIPVMLHTVKKAEQQVMDSDDLDVEADPNNASIDDGSSKTEDQCGAPSSCSKIAAAVELAEVYRQQAQILQEAAHATHTTSQHLVQAKRGAEEQLAELVQQVTAANNALDLSRRDEQEALSTNARRAQVVNEANAHSATARTRMDEANEAAARKQAELKQDELMINGKQVDSMIESGNVGARVNQLKSILEESRKEAKSTEEEVLCAKDVLEKANKACADAKQGLESAEAVAVKATGFRKEREAETAELGNRLLEQKEFMKKVEQECEHANATIRQINFPRCNQPQGTHECEKTQLHIKLQQTGEKLLQTEVELRKKEDELKDVKAQLQAVQQTAYVKDVNVETDDGTWVTEKVLPPEEDCRDQ